MAQYAIAFDMDTTGMKAAGLSATDVKNVYQKEIPAALAQCGFKVWLQGSVYATEVEGAPLPAIMRLQSVLRQQAPQFCRFVNRVHVFRMEEWSDVTDVIKVQDEVDAGSRL
jgi:virulence-associated protein VapD